MITGDRTSHTIITFSAELRPTQDGRGAVTPSACDHSMQFRRSQFNFHILHWNIQNPLKSKRGKIKASRNHVNFDNQHFLDLLRAPRHHPGRLPGPYQRLPPPLPEQLCARCSHLRPTEHSCSATRPLRSSGSGEPSHPFRGRKTRHRKVK